MASACGLQAAIYLVGQLRVAVAIILGSLARLIGVRGVFYRIVGKAATAIDDLTGTLPPFDRFVVFGPTDPHRAVQDIEVGSTWVEACSISCCENCSKLIMQERTGLRAAIVDVNDLSSNTGGIQFAHHAHMNTTTRLLCHGTDS